MKAPRDSNGPGRQVAGPSRDGTVVYGSHPLHRSRGPGREPGRLGRVEGALRALVTLRPLRWGVEAWRTGRTYVQVARGHAAHFEVEEAHLVDVPARTVLLAAGGRPGRALDEGRRTEVLAVAMRRGFHPCSSTHDGLRTSGTRTDTHALVLLWRGLAPVDLATRTEERLLSMQGGHTHGRGDGRAARPFVQARSALASCFAWSERAPHRRPWLTAATASLVLGLAVLALTSGSSDLTRPDTDGSALRATTPVERHAPSTGTDASSSVAARVEAATPTPEDTDAEAIVETHEMVEATDVPAVDRAKAEVRADRPRDTAFAVRPADAVRLAVETLGREARVLGQARLLLQPPPSADLALDGDDLVLTGRVTRPWLEKAHRLRPALTDVRALREEGLIVESRAFTQWRAAHRALEPPATVRLDVVGATLVARGGADHAWIAEAPRRANGVEGIEQVDVRRVVDLDRKRLDRARTHLASLGVLFEADGRRLSIGQGATLDRIAADARTVREAASRLRAVAVLEDVPPAPLSGLRRRTNGVQLELRQALIVREELRRRGVSGAEVIWPPPIGGPSALPTPEGRTWVRFRVSIR